MKKIAIFASGNGTNFEAIAEACRIGDIDASIVALVCDKPNAGVLKRAGRFPNIDVIALDSSKFNSKEEFEERVKDRLEPHEPDIICLAGYMRIIGPTLLNEYRGRIINIHPSLLPSFKGSHAIRDAFNYGVKVFGVTIHYVDHTLDGGPIIAQSAFGYEGADLEELEAMIHRVEHDLYPSTVAKLLSSY